MTVLDGGMVLGGIPGFGYCMLRKDPAICQYFLFLSFQNSIHPYFNVTLGLEIWCYRYIATIKFKASLRVVNKGFT